MIIKAGTILLTSTGEYSDYNVDGPFKVTKDFDQKQLMQEYLEKNKHKDRWKKGPDEFKAYLALEGYIEDMENVVSWHLGDYGRLEMWDCK